MTLSELLDFCLAFLTTGLSSNQLSEFFGNLYEGTRDVEEEQRIAEAKELVSQQVED